MDHTRLVGTRDITRGEILGSQLPPQRLENKLAFAGNVTFSRLRHDRVSVSVKFQIDGMVQRCARGHDLNLVSGLTEGLSSIAGGRWVGRNDARYRHGTSSFLVGA